MRRVGLRIFYDRSCGRKSARVPIKLLFTYSFITILIPFRKLFQYKDNLTPRFAIKMRSLGFHYISLTENPG